MSVEVAFGEGAGGLRYRDSREHFENGLLRLMNLSREEFDRWFELAERPNGLHTLGRLRTGWELLRPNPSQAGCGPVEAGPTGAVGRVWHKAIAESPSHGVAICEGTARYGWLVRWDGERFARETEPPGYEAEYFEGDRQQAGGYGDYTAQAPWRLEKATRQVREMRDLTGVGGGRVLDIGSGYGFFRVALGEADYEHDGLEVSRFAREVAARTYGLTTYAGTLDQHRANWEGRYDVVTLFDLIEHLADPWGLLADVASILRPGGVVGVKTPNLECPEAEVFGAHYHSLKREHLVFFTPESLTAAAVAAGLEPVHVTTISHLLVGFVGSDQVSTWEDELRGADIKAWYRKR
jgi:2-polyprenyl-3-methyl-5-hydroxy-6-metoxy-1,4-benzoquinol methylase